MGSEVTAIVELDPEPHEETIGASVGRYSHSARSKPIQSIRLILCSRHQARERQLHALGGIALENEAVEGIECDQVLIEYPTRSNVREHAALGSVRIDVIELLEIRSIFEIAKG